MRVKSIAVITHEYDSEIRDGPYFLSYLIRAWEQQGIEVHVISDGRFVPADIAILHVDTTVVGEAHMELAARYPVAVNSAVKDISRSTFSSNLLGRDDDYEGQVIVKTEANYGGVPEQQIEWSKGNSAPLHEGVQRPWGKVEYLESASYPILDHLREVPRGVWRNSRLVVEKFLPERLDSGEYRLRTCLFFGEQEFGMWFVSPDPVVKFSNASAMGVLDSLPESFREIRRKNGFMLGRFDFTMVDGEPVLFDMNKTPVTGNHGQAYMPEDSLWALANEIHTFV